MRVRNTSILEAFEVTDLSDETMFKLVNWMHLVDGGNILTDRHGTHMHVRGKGMEFEIHEAALPIWLLRTESSYFALTADEFRKDYEVVGSPIEDVVERVAVQDNLLSQPTAMGTIFQALVNSGLTRDQALDGLTEINKTGVVFTEKSEIARARLFQDTSPRCGRCDPATHSKYPHGHHETAEHDQWLKYHLGQETNNA